jgi:hypothetical protein
MSHALLPQTGHFSFLFINISTSPFVTNTLVRIFTTPWLKNMEMYNKVHISSANNKNILQLSMGHVKLGSKSVVYISLVYNLR